MKSLLVPESIQLIRRGATTGILVVIGEPFFVGRRVQAVVCECACGNRKVVRACHLISGATKSCGCSASKAVVERCTTHGMRMSRIYGVWNGMKMRCKPGEGARHRNYSARGIAVCKEWTESFQAFYEWSLLNGYSDDLTIDRIDSDGNYEPSNCRWATIVEQANNTRRNVRINALGETKTLREWSRDARCVVAYSTLQARVAKGWEPEEALTHALVAKGHAHKKLLKG